MGNGAGTLKEKANFDSLRNFKDIEKMSRNGYFRDDFEYYKEVFTRAIQADAIDLLEVLIPAGDSKLLKPLHLACTLGKLEAVELLCSAGMSIYLKDDFERTPLHSCSFSVTYEGALCATLLALRGKKALTMFDSDGNTPLHAAAIRNNIPLLKILTDFYPKLNLLNRSGRTAQQIAHQAGCKEAAELLFERSQPSYALTRAAGSTAGASSKTRASTAASTHVDQARIMEVWERFFENAFMHHANQGNNNSDSRDSNDSYRSNSKSSKAKNASTKSLEQSSSSSYYNNSEFDDQRYSSSGYSSNKHESSKLLTSRSTTAIEPHRSDRNEYSDYGSNSKSAKHNNKTTSSSSSKNNFSGTTSSKKHASSSTTPRYDEYIDDDNDNYTSSNNNSTNTLIQSWFSWVICSDNSRSGQVYDADEEEDQEGEYIYNSPRDALYVLHTLTGETRWLNDHLAFMAEELGGILSSAWYISGTGADDSSTTQSVASSRDYLLTKSLPSSLHDAVCDGWCAYYDRDQGICWWYSIPTGTFEASLPLGMSEHVTTLNELGICKVGGAPSTSWYECDQLCALSWVMVVGSGGNSYASGGAGSSPPDTYRSTKSSARGSPRMDNEWNWALSPQLSSRSAIAGSPPAPLLIGGISQKWTSSRTIQQEDATSSPTSSRSGKHSAGNSGSKSTKHQHSLIASSRGSSYNSGIYATNTTNASGSSGTSSNTSTLIQYYMNTVTGETSWTPPPNWYKVTCQWNDRESSGAGEEEVEAEWILCCSEGATEEFYWYNTQTGESSWVERE